MFTRTLTMKFASVSRGDDRSNNIKYTMNQYLTDFDLIYDVEEPDLVISVGGDGTFLEAFHRYVHRIATTAFIGVHTGHLGFYADWTPDEVERLVIERSEEHTSELQSRFDLVCRL